MIKVNLKHLFLLQKKLDQHITKEKALDPKADRIKQKSLALIVEIGELANEWRGFKFWSNKRAIDRAKMLEEYVDCLHFLLSMGLEVETRIDQDFMVDDQSDENGVDRFIEIIILAYYLSDVSDYFYATVCEFIGLGLYLGFTWEEVELAYVRKNKVNHERQANGY